MSKQGLKSYTLEEIRALKSETDWDALAKSEPYTGKQEFEVDWEGATLELPEPKQAISLRVDKDVLDFFKAQGKGYQTRMNAVLKAYKEAIEKQG